MAALLSGLVLAAALPARVAVADDVGGGPAGATAEAELVATYLPELRLQVQPEACGPGEPYRPMAADAVLGRDGVVLRAPEGDVPRPTEADLGVPGDGEHIDLPGNALRPGCSYERLFDAWRTDPTVYARVTTDPERPGELVLQYWLFYLYNDWNDRHEGDWEMVQLHFPADDAAGALATSPTLAAFAQHEGAELSDWEGGPLEVVGGTHPVVYVAAGSHAAYFRSDRWFGKSAQSGFGCDDTRGPSEAIRPNPVLLDDDELPAWARFEGHWGERRPSFNNGPTGPITKTQWTAPVRWVEDSGRRGAVALPADGSNVTDFFCEATSVASQAMFRMLDQPVLVGGVLFVVLAAVVVLVRRTTWSPVSTTPVRQRRRLGQILRSAVRIVARRPRQFAVIGSVILVGGVAASTLQWAFVRVPGIGRVADVADRTSASGGLLGVALGLVAAVPAAALTIVATVDAVLAIDRGERARLRTSLRHLTRDGRVIAVQALAGLVLAVSLLTVVLAPVGIWLVSRWAVALPAAAESKHPLRRSSELTRGRRPRCAVMVLINATAVSVVPVTVGVLVLLVTDAAFALVNAIAAVVGLFTVPTAGVASTLLYLDLELARGGSPGDGTPGVVDEGAVVA